MTKADAAPYRDVIAETAFSPVPAGVRSAGQRMLSRLIDESTPSKDLARELEGSSFALEIEGAAVKCVLVARDGGIAIESETETPTATIRATPLDLLALARASSVTTLRGTGAEVRGDLHVAEKFAELLKLARPDLEEELARWIGDLAAHRVGQAARGLIAWLGRAGEALAMNTAEYLQEESRSLPAAPEARAFYSDVERLRDDVERAAARLARVEQQEAVHASHPTAS